MDPRLVGARHFEYNKVRLAEWQLNRRFGVAEHGIRARNGVGVPRAQERREVIEDISWALEEQFPSLTESRHRVATWVQREMATTPAENAWLSTLKFNGRSLGGLAGAGAGDALHGLLSTIERADIKLALLNFQLGFTDEMPEGLPPESRNMIGKARAELRRASRELKTFAILPYLDERSGLLADPHSEDEVLKLCLGDAYSDPIWSKLLRTYLGVLQVSEKKTLLAHILSGVAAHPEKKATISAVLDGFDAFGRRAKQALAASGFVSLERRRELRGAFNRADLPEPEEVEAQLKQAFGEKLKGVERIFPIAGAGTLNYAVTVTLTDPDTGRPRRSLVRIRRLGIAGRVINENRALEAATEILLHDSDPRVRKVAKRIEALRKGSFATMAPGGVEADLSKEPALRPVAEKVYRRPAPRRGGYRMEVVSEVLDYGRYFDRPPGQAQPSAELMENFSIYEHVSNQDLGAIRNPELRSELAGQILKAELEAIFKHGIFDPDGQPGNWLVDSENRRLVRIDYARVNPEALPTEARQSLRAVFGALIRPTPDAELLRTLVTHYDRIFDATPGVAPALGHAALAEILLDPGLPPYDSPHERLFFIQGRLEELLSARAGLPDLIISLQPDIEKTIESLSRINIFAEEHLKPGQYGRLFAKAVGANRVGLGVELARRQIRLNGAVPTARRWGKCLWDRLRSAK